MMTGWQLCPLPAGSVAHPGQLPASGQSPWVDVPALGTVAEVLRQRREWSIDGAAREFDEPDWWYARTITLPAGSGCARLCLDGLATIAQVWLDDTLALSSDNMFLAHQLELPLGPQPREVRLTLCFRSLELALARRRPRPRWRTPMVRHQQLRWWRTTLLGRTPGWTPPVAPVGPWRPVRLLLPGERWLGETRLAAVLDGGDGRVSLTAALERDAPAATAACLHIERNGRHWRTEATISDGSPRMITAECTLPAVDRWWPHTHGEPALHACTLELEAADGSRHTLPLGQLGFRELRLDRSDGGFRLLVNGTAVFCRGACWTPLDPVTLVAGTSDYASALAEVRALGMNMLRISGTLNYEDEGFFAACDTQGILVWQDFMFASMDYPFDDAGFAAGAECEARQQLARWRGHACLAVLCGSSEGEQQAAMWGADRALWQPAFLRDTLAACCAELCPGVPYWPSSAHGGSFPHQVDQGTTSYYGVGAYLRPLEDARRSGLRFATECLAFANVPDAATIARMPGGHALRVHHPGWKARTCRDLNAGWDFEDVRDHYLALLHGVEPARLRYSDHGHYLALARVTTGEVMARSFAEWRRQDSPCGGALVWFLRDLWAGAGWGVLDERGARKACAHLLARALQPTALALTDEGNSGLHVHLVHDRDTPLSVTLEARSWSAEGTLLFQGDRALTLAPRSASRLPLLDLSDRFEDFNWAFRFGPLAHAAVGVRLRAGDATLAQDLYLAGPPGGCSAHGGLRASWSALPDGGCEIAIETLVPACHVHFVDANFTAPDQYFHVLPGWPLRLRLAAGACGSEAAPRAMLAASNLRELASLSRAAPADGAAP